MENMKFTYELSEHAKYPEEQRVLCNSGSLKQCRNCFLWRPNSITRTVMSGGMLRAARSRERCWNEITAGFMNPTITKTPIRMRPQSENYVFKGKDRRQETHLKQKYSERYGINYINNALLKTLPDVDAVDLRTQVRRPWSVDVMGTGQLGHIAPTTKCNMSDFVDRKNVDETAPENTIYIPYNVTNKRNRRSLNSPFDFKTTSEKVPRDGLTTPETENANSCHCEYKLTASQQRVPRGSTELSRTVTSENISPGTAISRRENCRQILHRRLTGFFEAESSGFSEPRGDNTELDSNRLEVNGKNWSKVKQAIILGSCARNPDSQTTDLTQTDDQGSPDHVDTRKFQQTKPRRMVVKEPSRMDLKSEIKNVDVDEGDAHVAVTSLMEDPILLEAKIMAIQFHHRALINDQKDMNNRWIITTNSVAGKNCLSGNNLDFDGQVVKLLPYDEVINTEYQQFVRMKKFVSVMDSRNILS